MAAVADILSFLLALKFAVTAWLWPGPPVRPPISHPPQDLIAFSRVPPQVGYGESGAPRREIEGRISAGLPQRAANRVVIYSYTNQWYVQPFEDSYLTPISHDGVWRALIRGGTHYLVLLVPEGFRAPSHSQAPPNYLPGVITWAFVAGDREWYKAALDFISRLWAAWIAFLAASVLAKVVLWLRSRKRG
jgi:hypothetical protein